jgi:cyanate lyase
MQDERMDRTMEQRMADQIALQMRIKGVTQSDYARHRGVSRQSVTRAFSGKKGLLTGQAVDILEWLGLEITLTPTKEG